MAAVVRYTLHWIAVQSNNYSVTGATIKWFAISTTEMQQLNESCCCTGLLWSLSYFSGMMDPTSLSTPYRSGSFRRQTNWVVMGDVLRTWPKHELFAVSWHLHRNRPTVARNSTYGSSNWILCVTLKMEAVHSIAKLVTTYTTTWSQTKSQTSTTIHMRRCRKQTGILSGRLK